jgi:hypothetical protein
MRVPINDIVVLIYEQRVGYALRRSRNQWKPTKFKWQNPIIFSVRSALAHTPIDTNLHSSDAPPALCLGAKWRLPPDEQIDDHSNIRL